MKMIGNEVYIQRGETWALDFAVKDKNGHPFMLFKDWQNPYIAITVTAAMYEQEGDFRRTYWLDLTNQWVEQEDGSLALVPVKKFVSTEPLYAEAIFNTDNNEVGFDIADLLSIYGPANGGKIVADPTSENDITNFLFYGTLDRKGGIYHYRYVKSYTKNNDGTYTAEWEDYDFRIVKQFVTKDWTEQSYLYDIKILTGESLEEHIATILRSQNVTFEDFPWSSQQTRAYIDKIVDVNKRVEMLDLYASGVPLMPDYEVKTLILPPTKLYTSVNIQGGVR